MRRSEPLCRMRVAGLCLLVTVYVAGAASAEAPRVTAASPDDGEADVDPATKELRITFDQDMQQGGMSIVGGGPTFPADPSARAHWVDAKTIVMPLRLAPGRSYQLSINSVRFRNFRSTGGESAVPYPIRFKTRSGKAKGTPKALTQAENRRAVDRLKKAIAEDYSHHDRLGVDWDAAFRGGAGRMLAAKTPLEFAKRAAELLAPAKDMHLWLNVGDWQEPTFERKVTPNFARNATEQGVSGLKRKGAVATGRFPDGMTYIQIASWSPEVEPQLAAAYRAIGEADASKGMILDVRPNGGGAEPLAQQVAGCFLEAPVAYAKHVTRKGGRFSAVRSRMVAKNEKQPAYRGKVAVLMGPANMSSCESFLLMMKQVPGCTLVGGRSYGSSGNPKPVDLGNGVIAFVPSWKDLRLDETSIEGEGIAPDVKVEARPSDFSSGKDPVLDAALMLLRKK